MKLDSLKSRFTDESIYEAMETDLGDYIESLEEITSEIPIVDTSIKPIITCLKNAIKLYLKVSGAEEKALSKEEFDYLTSCFVQNVEAFKDGIMPVLQVEYDEMIVNHLIDVIDVESIYEAKVNLIDFYKNPVGSSINAKISQAVVSVFCTIMPEYNQSFIYDVWNNTILSTAETLLNDEFFMCRDKIRNYVVFSESSEAKKMHALRIKHHKQIMALEEQKVFEEENATVKNLYCPIDIEIHYEAQEPSPLDIFKNKQVMEDKKDCIQEDFFALNEWLHDKKCNTAVLSGEPGYGKSTVLINFAARLSEKGYLVFLINIGDIKIHSVEHIYTDIVEALKKYEYFKYVYGKSQETYINQLSEFNDAVFIFDGLDEVVCDDYAEAIKEIFKTSKIDIGANNKIIISGRKNLFEMNLCDLNNIRRLEILPLQNKNGDRRELFWNKFCNLLNTKAPFENLKFVEESLLDIPLLLFMLVWVAKENDELELINKAELYDLITFTVYSKCYDASDISKVVKLNSREYDDYKKKLRIIGTTCFIKKTRRVSFQYCIDYAEYMGVSIQKNDFNKLLIHFYIRNEGEYFYFYHKEFCDYLFSQEIMHNILRWEMLRHFHIYGLIQFDDMRRINYFLRQSYLLLDSFSKNVFKLSVEGLLESLLTSNYPQLEQILSYDKIYIFLENDLNNIYICNEKIKGIGALNYLQDTFDRNIWNFFNKILFSLEEIVDEYYELDACYSYTNNIKLNFTESLVLQGLSFNCFYIETIDINITKCKFMNCSLYMCYIKDWFQNMNFEVACSIFQETKFIFSSFNAMLISNEFINSKITISVLGELILDGSIFINCDITYFLAGCISRMFKDRKITFENCFVFDGKIKKYFTGDMEKLNYKGGFIKDYIIAYNKEYKNKT